MLKSHLKGPGAKIDNEKIRQKISEQLTDDLVGKISYKDENHILYELECNSSSGEIKFGNLVDVIDIKLQRLEFVVLRFQSYSSSSC